MQRVDVRCNVDLPVTVTHVNDLQVAVEKNASFSVLSLNGALINCDYPDLKQNIVDLKYELPKHGEFELFGGIVHRGKDQIAVQFYNVNRDTKIKLWDYIKENITVGNSCPYCGAENAKKVSKCGKCGWSLNFLSPDYLIQHEKESFIKRLIERTESLSNEDIFRILNYIDIDILSVGKSWDFHDEIIGSSSGMLEVLSKIRKLALSDLPVLITGEEGTGKSQTARAIYNRSLRKHKMFVPINCSSIPEKIQDTELFGSHKKGSFSGNEGKVGCAEGGTVMVCDIENLSGNLISKFLKLLNENTLKNSSSMGDNKDIRLIISASSISKVPAPIRKYFDKSDSHRIDLKPVRDRGADRVILARFFLNKFSRELSVKKTFSKEALEIIGNYDWPGNVNEIKNKIRSAVFVSSGESVTPSDLDLEMPSIDLTSLSSLRDVKNTVERKKLIEALKVCNNNISRAAKVLGISRPYVYSLKRKYGI
jgi:transcriptional regulator with GAF, ATPase, and Fis domain